MENWKLHIEMPDKSVWAVPVMAIARNRAENYKDEFGDDVERSLAEDTIPLFMEDTSEITDWSADNMNWEDVEDLAVKVGDPSPPDLQEGWVNGEKWVVKVTADT